jgi:DNA recombination protein RmuC
MTFDLVHVVLLALAAAGFGLFLWARQGGAPELARLKAELDAARQERERDGAEHRETLNTLRQDNERGFASLKADHDKMLAGLRADHDKSVAGLKSGHDAAYAALKQDHDTARQRAEAAEKRAEAQDASMRERELAIEREREQFQKLQAEAAERFKAIADSALVETQKKFVELADETLKKHHEGAKGQLDVMLKPIHDTFGQFREKVEAIEKTRSEDRAKLDEQLKAVNETARLTHETTTKLSTALSSTRGAGRWGEETLRNVLEVAGLSPHADFVVQTSANTETGRIRPDVIVNMPGGRCLVIDSKVSLEDYLAAAEETDPQRKRQRLANHATRVKAHVTALSRKDYWKDIPATVDFVVMFLPGENFYSAVLEHDRDIFDYAWRNNVMIATPSTLIALAKSVAFGWRQEQMAKNAEEAARLGKELYDRLTKMSDHMNKVGGGLGNAMKAYNDMLGSYESRVLVSARKFEELSFVDGNAALETPSRLDLAPRQLTLLETDPPAPASAATKRK